MEKGKGTLGFDFPGLGVLLGWLPNSAPGSFPKRLPGEPVCFFKGHNSPGSFLASADAEMQGESMGRNGA